MLRFILRRILLMIPTVIAISILSFLIIQAPPGNYVTTYIAALEARGDMVDEQMIAALNARYGMNQPIYIQYFKWSRNLIQGDLGMSMAYNEPVSTLIAERLPLTMLVSSVSLLFVYAVGIPIGMISATQQYSVKDYIFTFIGFIGLAVPNFLFALVLLWLYFLITGNAMLGLFSVEYQIASWSFAKLIDLLKHLWMPAIVIGTAGTAGLIRIMRANILDELKKQYVVVARSKGLPERKMLYKYPFRLAMNPVISTIGWTLPGLINGELLTSLVLGLPTLAPIFLNSLLTQDMFLAGSIVFILTTLTIIGTLISDMLLAWVDPRIKESV